MIRHAVTTVILVLCASLPLMSQTPATQKLPQITFTETKYDFGKLKYRGPGITHEFAFTNTGDAPLVIMHAEVTCRCLKVSYPKKPVDPGQSGTIAVTYSPKNELGSFSNDVRIYTNGADRRHIVKVEGEVIRR